MSSTPDIRSAGIGNGRRKLLLSAVLAAFAAVGIGVAGWWLASGRYYESTGDAYVGGNLVQITPQVAGTVLAIRADDTDYVSSGNTLVELDKAEANVALRRADLGKAKQDLARRRGVESSGAVSGEELQHAVDAHNAARAAL